MRTICCRSSDIRVHQSLFAPEIEANRVAASGRAHAPSPSAAPRAAPPWVYSRLGVGVGVGLGLGVGLGVGVGVGVGFGVGVELGVSLGFGVEVRFRVWVRGHQARAGVDLLAQGHVHEEVAQLDARAQPRAQLDAPGVRASACVGVRARVGVRAAGLEPGLGLESGLGIGVGLRNL